MHVGCSAPRPAAQSRRPDPPQTRGPVDAWTYALVVDEDLRRIQVRMCFPEAVPEAIQPGGDAALAHVDSMSVAGRPVRPAGRVRLGRLPPGSCVDYGVDLTRAEGRAGWSARRLTPGGVRIARTAACLWEPTTHTARPRVTAEVRVTGGVSVSVPWTEIAPGRYVLPPSTFRTHGRAVLGRFEIRRQRVAGALIEAAVVGDASGVDRGDAIDGILRDAALGVATVFGGRFPRPKGQFIVLPQPGAGVGFGEAERGGGGAVLLMVGERARYARIKSDWTAIHETFHIAMPQTLRGNAWLSEGVASYYQYLLLARVGRLDPRAAWSELNAGFARGRSDHTGRTLREDSRGLGRHGAYWRVYWGGAAWAFRADVALRRRGRSLDALVRHWRGCCPDETSWWNAEPLLKRGDAWLGEDLLVPLAEAALDATEPPDLADLYLALGLHPDDGGVALRDAPESALRDAITSPTQ